MRPCCVTASVSSLPALTGRVSREQAVAVGHSSDCELVGSFAGLPSPRIPISRTSRSEVSVPSDKAAAHEALDFVGSLEVRVLCA